MPPPPTKSLVNIDFDGLKQSFIEFLKANPTFKDYNFDGSNLNVLLDVLALNSTYNQFYLNMALSESFLDSAVLRPSVVSHAKELNYLPRSARSPVAFVRLQIFPTGNPETITVPAGTMFMTNIDSVNYTFVTASTNIIQQIAGAYVIESLPIYEGRVVTESFLVDNTIPTQRFVLSNKNIDVTSLQVDVFETSASTTSFPLTYTNTLLGIGRTSAIFTLQNTGSQYEILFGDGVIGIKPQNQNVIRATYRVCSGNAANRASVFTPAGAVGGHTNVRITTITSASGGAPEEDIESIRFYAPRYFQTQDRAVTESDYETLLRTQFPDIETISVFGGETLDPPQFGRVVISIDTVGRTGLTSTLQTAVLNFIKDRTTVTIDPVVLAPDFTFLEVVTNVKYDPTRVTQNISTITERVLESIRNFRRLNLNNFKTKFILSKLQTEIDAADAVILGNATQIRLQKRPPISFTSLNTLELEFQTPGRGFQSSPYVLNGNRVYLEDNGAGVIQVVTSLSSGDRSVVVSNAGTINYQTGRVILTKFQVDSITTQFRVYLTPTFPEVSVKGNTILELDLNDVAITLTPA